MSITRMVTAKEQHIQYMSDTDKYIYQIMLFGDDLYYKALVLSKNGAIISVTNELFDCKTHKVKKTFISGDR